MKILGVDPSTEGSFALLDLQENLLAVDDIPIAKLFSKNIVNGPVLVASIEDLMIVEGIDRVFIELQSGRKGEGAAGARTLGTIFGQVIGIAQGLKIPVDAVSPAKWKGFFKITPADTKDVSRQIVHRLYPQHLDRFRRKKDHNRADAVLIALYAVRNLR